MWDLVQITAQYSNAVLVAVMPYISDFAEKLDLATARPVTVSQVREFRCDPRAGQTGGAVTLTNGFQFTFLDGRVCVYRSPHSYFSLQDPEKTPRFYGPVNVGESNALRIARSVIKRLGYENSVFNADSPPVVTRPEKINGHYVPRYRFRWPDPRWPNATTSPDAVRALLDVEVNATSGDVEMVQINSRETRRPPPKVTVAPERVHQAQPTPKLTGGTKTEPVSSDYSNAFLRSILPQLSDFTVKAGLQIHVPVTADQVVASNYICRILDGQPMAQLYLTNGDRFNYRDGYVSAFYAHDAFIKFPDMGRVEDFLGHINVTTNEAISLCEDVMRRLGFTGKFPEPTVSYSPSRGSLQFKRFTYYWQRPGDDVAFAAFEVDMESKAIKSIFLKDAQFRHGRSGIELPKNPALPESIPGAAVPSGKVMQRDSMRYPPTPLDEGG